MRAPAHVIYGGGGPRFALKKEERSEKKPVLEKKEGRAKRPESVHLPPLQGEDEESRRVVHVDLLSYIDFILGLLIIILFYYIMTQRNNERAP